jgi:hypothetical protein
MSDYNELLLDAYKGELFGEALFTAMAEREEFEDHAAQIRTLATIERRTAATLQPLVEAAGLECDEDESRAQGRELGGAGGDWLGFVRALHDALPPFLANFVRLRELADDPHDKALAALVAHELAINAFAELELTGNNDVSLVVLTRYLEEAP